MVSIDEFILEKLNLEIISVFIRYRVIMGSKDPKLVCEKCGDDSKRMDIKSSLTSDGTYKVWCSFCRTDDSFKTTMKLANAVSILQKAQRTQHT